MADHPAIAEPPSPAHLFVATPCYGGLVTQIYMQSVLALVVEAATRGIPLSLGLLGQDALITRSRNTLVARFLASEATHLLFVDADIGFPPEAAFRLLAAGEDVIGGMYPIRTHVWDAATHRLAASGEPLGSAALRYVGEPVGAADERALIPASYAGTGFLMVARRAILQLQRAHPETRCRHAHVEGGRDEEIYALFDCLIDKASGHYLSEDFAFCARWRATGGRIWLDPSISLTHAGMTEHVGMPALRHLAAAA